MVGALKIIWVAMAIVSSEQFLKAVAVVPEGQDLKLSPPQAGLAWNLEKENSLAHVLAGLPVPDLSTAHPATMAMIRVAPVSTATDTGVLPFQYIEKPKENNYFFIFHFIIVIMTFRSGIFGS